MQLSNSSTPTDPASLALLFPGAMPTSPNADARNVLAECGELPTATPVFADLFAELVPSLPTPPEQTTTFTPGLPTSPRPILGVPANERSVSLEPPFCTQAVTDLGASATVTTEAAPDAEKVDDAPSPTSKPKEVMARPARPTASKSVRSNDSASPVGTNPSTPTDFSTVDAVNRLPLADEPKNEPRQPNEHASDAAFATPRFTGLPTVAVEHRATQKLPPGLERPTTDADAAPTEPDLPEPDVDASAAPEADATSTFQSEEPELPSSNSGHEHVRGRPTDWRGASGEHQDREFPSPNGLNTVESDRALRVTPRTVVDFDRVGETNPRATPVAPLLEERPAMPTRAVGPNAPVPPHAAAEAMVRGLTPPHRIVPSNHLVARAVATLDGEQTYAEPAVLLPVPATANVAEVPRQGPAIGLRREAAADRRENFAFPVMDLPAAKQPADSGAIKSVVGSEPESLATHGKPLGIAVAKASPTMFARFAPAPMQHPASEYAAAPASAGAVVFDPVAPTDSTTAHAVGQAHQAVEVVLRAIEQAASKDHRAVNLQFSVGDANLSVRVEVHADEVRTTFRTDSADLRAALAHEWQAVGTSLSGDRTLRIVPAVFNAAEQSALNSFAGDTPSRQRNPSAHDEPRERSMIAALRARTGSVVAKSPTATSLISAAPLTSRRLHTTA